MISNHAIKETLIGLGYRPTDVHEAYRFAAVDRPNSPVQETALATFFGTPPSYRNAAIGVVRVLDESEAEQAVEAQRALGAPFLLAISQSSVSAWTITSRGPSKLDQAHATEWLEFSARHACNWSADSVRRLKSVQIRTLDTAQQLLFDPTFLYTIQIQVQVALDKLLRQFLRYFESPQRTALALQRDYRILFPLAFRLLAAKILYDREDPRVAHVQRDDVEGVIDAVSSLYSLNPLAIRWNASIRSQLRDSWSALSGGLHVRNIAADDLAFVYENTLITPETRKAYGTHSTPPSVAEYVIRSFNLPQGADIQDLNVYEPFAGSCVFLTAALRRFKELLPNEWSPERIHAHLVSHFSASEIDQFACEIARLSLILADYPNANGWHINNEDVFEDTVLTSRAMAADIVVCNPPFEDFALPPSNASIHKPVAALATILGRKPQFLGIVMPAGFEAHEKYRSTADRVASSYEDVELLELPEGTFRHASVGATVLIAQRPRLSSASSLTVLRKSTVHRAQRSEFERTLRPSLFETVSVDTNRAPGFVGLKPLRDLWAYLADFPTLDKIARIHRGIEWRGNQNAASSSRHQKGFRRGLHKIKGSLTQFRIGKAVYLDCREQAIRGGALRLRWENPKVICNAIRTSRGPWRLAAAVDRRGLTCSQQFFGVWLHEAGSYPLENLAALLNSPLASGFSFAHDPHKGLRVDVMGRIPLPSNPISSEIAVLIEQYVAAESEPGPLFSTSRRSAVDLLLEIDATVLAAYDLPPKLEKALLKLMNADGRPCGHAFGPFPGTEEVGAMHLKARLGERASRPPVDVWQRILSPLPREIADVFDVT